MTETPFAQSVSDAVLVVLRLGAGVSAVWLGACGGQAAPGSAAPVVVEPTGAEPSQVAEPMASAAKEHREAPDLRCGDEPWCSGSTPICAYEEDRWRCTEEGGVPSFRCADASHCEAGTVCCVAAAGSYCAEPSDCSVLSWQSFPCREASDCPRAPVTSDDGSTPMGTLVECGSLASGPPSLRVCRFGDESGAWP
ncbi:MAG: hypothetical protein KIT72_08160 [Polyangiaceae bacterium]|nr:hypothetical protein [Polyangiaceae bacterium]MCW5790380.1 hypothetical protein [Polyangiaceae bacterium]